MKIYIRKDGPIFSQRLLDWVAGISTLPEWVKEVLAWTVIALICFNLLFMFASGLITEEEDYLLFHRELLKLLGF